MVYSLLMKAGVSKERQILVVMPGAAISNWRKLEGIMSYAHTRPEWTVELLMPRGPGTGNLPRSPRSSRGETKSAKRSSVFICA